MKKVFEDGAEAGLYILDCVTKKRSVRITVEELPEESKPSQATGTAQDWEQRFDEGYGHELPEYELACIKSFIRAEIAEARKDTTELLEAAKAVMDTLHKYGPSIVPHLMDTDENDGERLRSAITKVEQNRHREGQK